MQRPSQTDFSLERSKSRFKISDGSANGDKDANNKSREGSRSRAHSRKSN